MCWDPFLSVEHTDIHTLTASHCNHRGKKKIPSPQHADLQLSPKLLQEQKQTFPLDKKKREKKKRIKKPTTHPVPRSFLEGRERLLQNMETRNKSPFHAAVPPPAPLRNHYENGGAGLAFGAFTAFLPINSIPGSAAERLSPPSFLPAGFTASSPPRGQGPARGKSTPRQTGDSAQTERVNHYCCLPP